MASLEGWGSTIELHPHLLREAERTGCESTCKNYSRLRYCASGRSVVASAPALGAGDREFESPRPDQFHLISNVIKGVAALNNRSLCEKHCRDTVTNTCSLRC